MNAAWIEQFLKAKYPTSSMGTFSTHANTLSWYECRESFVTNWAKTRAVSPNFLFYLGKKKLIGSRNPVRQKSVTDFIAYIETKLEIPERTTYHTSECGQVLLVISSPFWNDIMRMSLLTAVMRAAIGCVNIGRNAKCIYFDPEKNNIDEMIENNRYLRTTKPSFLKFMDGYTNAVPQVYVPTGIKYVASGGLGWATAFADGCPHFGRFVLEKPEAESEKLEKPAA